MKARIKITGEIVEVKPCKDLIEVDMTTAIIVQPTTNFIGCYIAMWASEKLNKDKL